MQLPFTAEAFFDVFSRYNDAVWPMQGVLIALAIVTVFLTFRGRRGDDRWVSAILAAFWMWMAAAYHLAFFARVNQAAVLFAAAFTVQSVLFAFLAWRLSGPAPPAPRRDVAGVLGALIVAYALVGYPALGYVFGHRYPAVPTFGVPCPTTIFTLGIIVWSRATVPWWLYVVPIGWAAVATVAATTLGVWEDFGLPVAAILTVAVIGTGRTARGGGRSDAAMRPAVP
jgi:hypothetical protein